MAYDDPWLRDDDDPTDPLPPSLSRLPFASRDWTEDVYDLLAQPGGDPWPEVDDEDDEESLSSCHGIREGRGL
jgi:hypothetical protein